VAILAHVVMITEFNVDIQNTDHVRIKRTKRDVPEFLKPDILSLPRDIHASGILKGVLTVPGVPREVTSVDPE